MHVTWSLSEDNVDYKWRQHGTRAAQQPGHLKPEVWGCSHSIPLGPMPSTSVLCYSGWAAAQLAQAPQKGASVVEKGGPREGDCRPS